MQKNTYNIPIEYVHINYEILNENNISTNTPISIELRR